MSGTARFLKPTPGIPPAAAAMLDLRGEILGVNLEWSRTPPGSRFLGSALSVGDNYLEFCARDRGPDAPLVRSLYLGIQEVIAGRQQSWHLEFDRAEPDGESSWTIFRATRLSGAPQEFVLVEHIDITSRRRGEEALRLTQFAVDHAGQPILWVEPGGRVLYANRAAAETFGYGEHELEALTVGSLLPPGADWPEVAGPATVEREAVFCRRDGGEFTAEVAVNRVDWRGRRFQFVFLRDISAERELAAERGFSSAILDTTAALVVVADRDGRIVRFNRAAEQATGLHFDDVQGRLFWDALAPLEEQGPLHARFERLVREGGSSKEEHPWRTADGHIRRVEAVWTVMPGEDGRSSHVILTGIDRTEQLVLESQFRQAQKMEAVGRLAGGVAHDFNNLLTIISGYSELLLTSVPEEQRTYVDEIHKAAKRASGLTRQLLAFSRREELKPVTLDLAGTVAGLEKMLRRLIGEDIELVTSVGPSASRILADPGQVEQCVMNLAVNARDAMPRGGRLTIETREVVLDEGYARLHAGVKPGRHMLLAVTDTGVGMDRETQTRLFEPFFTTKERGKGTGLGLSTVYGIVRRAGGHIGVYSELGRGTCFKLYFPVADASEPARTPTPPLRASPRARGPETVLVVEDDASVRQLIRRVLSEQGYRVIEASDGPSALRECAEPARPIRLLLTDSVMPQMSGPELAERLGALHSNLRVVFMSGYTEETYAGRARVPEGSRFLQKPFSADALARAIREALDSATPGS